MRAVLCCYRAVIGPRYRGNVVRELHDDVVPKMEAKRESPGGEHTRAMLRMYSGRGTGMEATAGCDSPPIEVQHIAMTRDQQTGTW